jgi:salicylate hydroxylase
VVASRTLVIAGAGIGGLTAALALAKRGFRSVVLDQAEQLEETGAGIQLSPNATRILIDLGAGERLRAAAVAPSSVRVLRGETGKEIVRLPLSDMEARYGAPYWTLHRGDLQAALIATAREHPDISLELGARVETFASHPNGVTVKAMRGQSAVDAQGVALIGADGIWSKVRDGLEDPTPPKFAKRVAYRALVPANMAAPSMREHEITLWLGRKGHIAHYPVQSGKTINVVAIAADTWTDTGWSTEATPAEVMARFASGVWSRHVRDLLGIPEHWLKWALAERTAPKHWCRDQIAILGDAAHPMLPFLAQGAAMAIEDAAVLAKRLSENPDNLPQAMQVYESDRRSRTSKVQRAARSNGKIYQYSGPDAAARDFMMRLMGGTRIRNRYDWVYNWRVDSSEPASRA